MREAPELNHLQPMASSGCCTAEGTDTDLGTRNTQHTTHSTQHRTSNPSCPPGQLAGG